MHIVQKKSVNKIYELCGTHLGHTNTVMTQVLNNDVRLLTIPNIQLVIDSLTDAQYVTTVFEYDMMLNYCN